MKLLRLTSEDTTGLYKSDFNSHLEIKPYSKIALQSVSAGAYPVRLDVDINNNELFVQWGDSDYTRDTVNLNLASYNSGNYRDLLDDIQNKCNEITKFDSSVTTSSQNNKTLGLEWAAYLDSTKHVNIGYKTGATKEYETQWEQTGTIIRYPSTGVWANNGVSTFAVDNYIGFPQYISRGCGSIHCRINNIGVTSEQGFAIGLTKNYLALQNNTFNIKDLDYGLTVYSPPNSGLLQYANIVKGSIYDQLTPVGFLGVGNVNNDSMQVRINGKYIEFNVYNEAAGKLPITTGANEVYTTGEQLYPVCIFFGQKTDTSLSFLRITPSPYFPSASNLLTTELSLEEGLGVPPKPIAGVKSKNYINFLSAELSTFLGFTSMRQPQSGVFDIVFPTFVAERAFNIPEFADTYMIQMLNLNVESYDSYSKNKQGGQRQNILAVLPSTSNTGSFVYEPNYPTFLDLDNKEHLSLRNLKMRIIYGDYSAIAAKGVGSIILLIKDKDE